MPKELSAKMLYIVINCKEISKLQALDFFSFTRACAEFDETVTASEVVVFWENYMASLGINL